MPTPLRSIFQTHRSAIGHMQYVHEKRRQQPWGGETNHKEKKKNCAGTALFRWARLSGGCRKLHNGYPNQRPEPKRPNRARGTDSLKWWFECFLWHFVPDAVAQIKTEPFGAIRCEAPVPTRCTYSRRTTGLRSNVTSPEEHWRAQAEKTTGQEIMN